MRDDHERLSRRETRYRPLYLVLVLGVGERRRLVEENDRGVLEDRPRDRYALALAAGEGPARLAGRSVDTLREPFHELFAAGRPGGRGHLLVRRLRPAEPDVLPDRRVEEVVVLRDEAHQLGELVEGHLADVHAAHGDRAALNVPMARDEAGEGGLARPGRPHQCAEAALGHSERHVVDDLVSAVIGKAHVVEGDRGAARFGPAVGLGELGQVEELPRIGDGVLHRLHLVDERREPRDRVDDGEGQDHAHRELRRGERALEVQPKACGNHAEQRCGHDARHEVHPDPRRAEPPHRVILEAAHGVSVLPVRVGRLVERLDHLDALDVLDDHAVHVVALGHISRVPGVELLEARCEHGKSDRHGHQAGQRHTPINGYEPRREPQGEEHRPGELGDHVGKRNLDPFDPIEKDALYLTDALSLHGAERCPHQLVYEVPTKRFQNGVGGHVGEQCRDSEQYLAHDIRPRR